MAAELQAKGIVLSSEPLLTLTADLVNHELRIMFRDGGGYLPTTVHISGQKLLDLIRLAQLALPQFRCWRCEALFDRKAEDCNICHFAAHCDSCSQYLHASEVR